MAQGPPAPAEEMDDPQDRIERAKAREHEGNVWLRRIIAVSAPLVMLVQLAFADYVFWRYAEAHDWRVPTAAINAWLGATVVQVIGVVLVVVSYLFPKGGPKR